MSEKDICLSISQVAERLLRHEIYTPVPKIKGVCGFPVASGIFLNIQFRCHKIINEETGEMCDSIRLKVLTVVANARHIHQPTICLRCGSRNMHFERIDVRTL